MDGSKFEPSIFYLLESQNLVFLKKKYIHDIFFASSPARLAVYIRDPSPLYTASFAGLEVEKVKCSSNRKKLDGSKFEPSIFYLLESQDLIFLTKN